MSLLEKLRALLARPDTTEDELRDALKPDPVDYHDTTPHTEPEPMTPIGAAFAEVASAAILDPYPLSRRATASEVRAAGVTNGMDADQVEQCLARWFATSA